jgi:hypothetical protein
MSLERKTLSELRAIAQSVGIVPDFSVGKDALLQQMRGHVQKQTPLPVQPVQINIVNQPDDRMLTQSQVEEALKDFRNLGLIITFPDAATWAMECSGKKDSGSMTASLWTIIGCAKEVVKP